MKGKPDIKSILPNNQIMRVSVENGHLDFYYDGEFRFKCDIEDLATNGRYDIAADLAFFKFGSGDNLKSQANCLYRKTINELSPVVYINDGLFDNTDLFDVNIMSDVKTTRRFRQMIGQVNVRCCNDDLLFNSDRTKFVQNPLTDDITKDLKKINKRIHNEIGEFRELVSHITDAESIPDSDLTEEKARALIREDHPFKEKIKIEIDRNENVVKYRLCGTLSAENGIGQHNPINQNGPHYN